MIFNLWGIYHGFTRHYSENTLISVVRFKVTTYIKISLSLKIKNGKESKKSLIRNFLWKTQRSWILTLSTQVWIICIFLTPNSRRISYSYHGVKPLIFPRGTFRKVSSSLFLLREITERLFREKEWFTTNVILLCRTKDPGSRRHVK